jgi:hypothetical protein
MQNPLINLKGTHCQVAPFGFSPAMLDWLLGRSKTTTICDILRNSDLKLLTELSANRLTPFIYQRILEQGLDGDLPQPVIKWLKNDCALCLQQAFLQEGEVVQVLRQMITAGVAPILLKGADFRLRLYGNPVARPMCDLDLLISPEDLPRAEEVLARACYTRAMDSHSFRPGFRKRFMGELHLNSPNGRLIVDLHWFLEAVGNFYRLPYQRLAHLALPWDYEGLPVRLLCPEHALIYLCLHHYDEVRNALQIVDLGLALTRLPLDWPLFLEEVAFFHCQAPIFLMLNGLQQIFPEAVPKTVLKSLDRYRPSSLERLALSPIFGKGFSPLVRLYHYRRLSDWAAYLAAIFWPHQDYLVAVLGKPDRAAYLWRSLKKTLP